jgi:mannose-1-phosphate guanylyltransferase
MDAVVLVGGEGTRLRPLTYEIPKQMLPVVERPMIVRVLEWLATHGVDRAVLSLGYRPDAFLRAFPEHRVAGVDLAYAVEPEPLDTAGAVRFAADKAGVDDTFLVLNGDVLTDFDAAALVEFHRSRNAQASIALTPVSDPSAFGVVPTDDTGLVTAFIEKPTRANAPTNLINAGIYVLEPAVLERIPTGRRVSIERETFPGLVSDRALYALASDAYWLDTGTPQQYLQAQLDILAGRRAELAPPAELEVRPGIWIDTGAEVVGKLGTHTFVGRGASVAEGAVVEDSVVGQGATVGVDAVVRRSVLMADARVGAGAVVEDSVVGPRAVIGEGARLAAATVVGVGAVVPARSSLDGARYPVA